MTQELIKYFIGYDDRLPVASSVLMQSANSRSSLPISFTLLNLEQLQKAGLYTREVNPLQSTQFSFSRFLTPYLSNYEGWSLFTDNDMIVLEDLAELWALRDDKYAVMCVKHDHNPGEDTKFMGAAQTKYEKKNWSSVILFNNAKCKTLTPEYVNEASGLQLHQFKWLENDDLIGEIPMKWNYLGDYTKIDEKPALIHYTEGGPFYPNYKNCEYSQEWFEEFASMNYCKEGDFFEQAKNAEEKLKTQEAV